MRFGMGSKVLTLSALVLLFAVGFTARLAYEHTLKPAFAQDEDPEVGLDCEDYDSQADAQAELRRNPSDPYVLDEDDEGADDGIACETYPYDNPARDETPVTTTTAPSSPEPTQASPEPTQASPAPTTQASPQTSSPQPNPERRESPTPRTGGLPGGALPAKPDGSCPANFPVKHNNICLPR
jgi:hypothetical protein